MTAAEGREASQLSLAHFDAAVVMKNSENIMTCLHIIHFLHLVFLIQKETEDKASFQIKFSVTADILYQQRQGHSTSWK